MTGNLASEIRQEWLEEKAEYEAAERKRSSRRTLPFAAPPWVADQPNYFPETATTATLTAQLQALHPNTVVKVQNDGVLWRITIGPLEATE